MPQLNESFLQELKYKTDIEDVVSAYVTLKRHGSTSKGLCPFHNEKTPSFTVYNDTQSFYCFGCGAGGDAVTFIKKIENLDYLDAVKLLAQRAGLQMPRDSFDDSLSKRRRIILEINREAAKFYYTCLLSEQGRAGLEYYLSRGLTKNTIKRFGLGYAPDKWDELLKHLKEKGYTISDMLAAGVIKKSQRGSYYDTFKNRVITPIIDVRGNVIAFGGRVLDNSKPKYVNTAETLVYKKTNELFALNLAKDSKADNLILCEGYMDVIAMHQAGFTNAVAGCGTALTNEQVRLIARYTKEVILAYDADEAGQKALNKAVALFRQADVKVKIPTLSGGKDPDEIIRKYGRDKFKGMLEGASNEIEFALLDLRNKFNLDATQGKIDFLNEAVKVLCNASPVEQDLYLSRLSNELGVEKSSIRLQMDAYKSRMKKSSQKIYSKKIINESIRQNKRLTYENNSTLKKLNAEKRIIGLLCKYPDCVKLSNGFDENMISSPQIKKLYSLIYSRLNNNLDIDLMNLSAFLTDDECAQLSKIISGFNDSRDAKKEFIDCIKTIESEYSHNNIKPSSEMSEDEYRNMFKLKDNT